MLAAPIYLCVAFVFAVIFYVAYNFTITLPVDSINTITGLESIQFNTLDSVGLLTHIVLS